MKEGNGRVIVLEGLDGCGKGVQMRKLKEMVGYDDEHRRDVNYRGRRVIFSREPGGTEFAEKMRTLIISGMKDLGGKTQLLNFFAARNDHWEKVVIPAVKRGDLVILDRSDMSTFAFQVYGQNNGQDLRHFFWGARSFVYGDYEPDVYFFIDVSPEECQRRIWQAMAEQGREVTNFDARDLDFHRIVRTGYTVFASGDKAVVRINGEQAIDLVHRDIRQVIEILLNR